MASTDYWIEVTLAPWATRRPLVWLFKFIGWLPRCAVRIRHCKPPEEEPCPPSKD